jgi:hypothetical protein
MERRAAPAALAMLGLTLLVLNPWTFNAVSFDLHTVVFGSCFAILTAYDIAHHNRRFWVWALLMVSAGDVAATYLLGIFISALLAGKAWRRDAIALGAVGFTLFGLFQLGGWSSGDQLGEFLSVANGRTPTSLSQGNSGGIVDLLKSLFGHPLRYAAEFGSHWLSIIANLWPSGGVGVFCAWGFGVPLVVIVENSLKPGVVFSDNTFQSVVVYLFVALGTVMVIARLFAWRQRVATLVAATLLASSLGWAIVWFPRLPDNWLRVSSSAAATLQSAMNAIPLSDQVAIEQGTVGGFADRPNVTLLGGSSSAILTPHVWFVIAPSQGIQTVPVNVSLGYMYELTNALHARIAFHGGGVWVFEWKRPSGIRAIPLLTSCALAPAWALSTQIGTAITKGPTMDWGMQSSLSPGYVVDGDYARLPAGYYSAAVNMSSNGPISVQVWDSARRLLVAQREVPSTNGRTIVNLPFRAPPSLGSPATEGVGPFRIVPIPPPANDEIEVRVSSPGGTSAFVDSIALVAANQSASNALAGGSC